MRSLTHAEGGNLENTRCSANKRRFRVEQYFGTTMGVHIAHNACPRPGCSACSAHLGSTTHCSTVSTLAAGADLSNAILKSTSFQAAIMDYVMLDGAIMEKTDFRDARLEGIELHNARFFKVKFARTSLRNAKLYNVRFVRSALEQAYTDGAIIRKSPAPMPPPEARSDQEEKEQPSQTSMPKLEDYPALMAFIERTEGKSS